MKPDAWDCLLLAGLALLSVPLAVLHWSAPFGLWGVAACALGVLASRGAARRRDAVKEKPE